MIVQLNSGDKNVQRYFIGRAAFRIDNVVNVDQIDHLIDNFRCL